MDNYYLNEDRLFPSIDELEVRTGTEIMDDIYLPVSDIVSGLICRGTYFLGGASKIGKSFMALEIAYHVSKGIPLWGMQVRQGPVLYLALEDTEKRLQHRMCHMFGGENADDLYLATTANSLSDGLEEQLKDFLFQHPKTSLIIIDTLQKVRKLDRGSYADDYAVVSAIKKFSDIRDLAIIIIHHVNKQEHDDIVNALTGTTGLGAAADGSFILKKADRKSNKAVLSIICRDLPNTEVNLSFDPYKLRWNADKIDSELWKKSLDPFVERVVNEVLGDSDCWRGSATDILDQLRISDMRTNVVSRRISCAGDQLLTDYKILVEFSRSSKARTITLRRVGESRESDDASDDNDAISDGVTCVILRHG